MKKVLTIAGSDSSGGAGVQADLKTMLANGVYGMSAITALTAQNTQGVRMVQEATPEFLAAEARCGLRGHTARCRQGRHGRLACADPCYRG